jgi:nucleotide-binding universal stress UspA family protein
MGHIRTILVPFDGSPPSLAALDFAATLADDTGATVDLLYVEPPDVLPTAPAPAASDELRRARSAAIDDVTARLGNRLRAETRAGDPLRVILEVASAGPPYDLIVMGTHGRVGRLRVLLGSVAEGVVRNAPCAVLTVREPGGEEESFAERIHRVRSVGQQTSGQVDQSASRR